MTLPAATILGYPRIGRDRDLKRILEQHWRGAIDDAALHGRAHEIRVADARRLVDLGLVGDAAVPGEWAHYDHVLDAAITVGAVPPRLRDVVPAGPVSLAHEWLLARGEGDVAPLEMTKWLDSNYHYLVPELDAASTFALQDRRIVERFAAVRDAGVVTRPAIVGPATLLTLATGDGVRPIELVDRLVPAYRALAEALAEAGAPWLQIDEPALVGDWGHVSRAEVEAAVRAGLEAVRGTGVRILLAVPNGDASGRVESLAPLADAVAVDLVRGTLPAIGGTIVAGVVGGRNVWRTDLDAALETLRGIDADVVVGTSTSLLHVPHDVDRETTLSDELRSWLAFADQKVAEVATLASALAGADESAALDRARDALAARRVAPGVADGAVRRRVAAASAADAERVAYDERVAAQADIVLPALPTTTIGSFPQTGDIRRARAAHARGELDDAGYRAAMEAEIRDVVALQERLGLDVLVHGEPERNDMVQYFAESLDGFAATAHGWVQSYGSRCTRPSILWGDVARPAPITVPWTAYAQSLTSKPVKGMLTGPVTILAWSFVRDDQPLADTAAQVAFALRDEVADLEAAGTRIVQVDEPALRELLPLEEHRRADYLDWSVRAFRIATGGAAPGTQVHTHLCYSEFGSIIDAIDGLDADVTSIEAARSRMEIVDDIAGHGYPRGIGPGVWDIHSPRVPGADELDELLATATAGIPAGRLWVNPDCGLKTRGYAETEASLERLVAAAERARERIGATV